MSNHISLKLTTEPDRIRIAAKNGGDVSVYIIELKLLMGHCWWEGLPAIETLISVLEDNIKNTILNVHPHQELLFEYTLRTNDSLEDSSEIEIQINKILADQEEIEVIGDILALEGIDDRGIFQKITSFRRKINENISQKILTK
ncbi:MAG: hypothetical protein ACP5C3_05805 [Methanomicrobiales archaeon]